MILSFSLKNFGCIEKAEAGSLAQINLIVGPNSVGKSILLKALYSGVKSAETVSYTHLTLPTICSV